MATVRIYLCTYRRNQLLPRAIQALQAQTFSDWVCELHNDDPQDPFPGEYLKELGDPRIRLVQHQENWGAMRVFNQVFRPVEEGFVSLLEDDNWWEPHFLETMLQTLDHHPEVNLAWANLRFCQEDEAGQWLPTGESIWPENDTCDGLDGDRSPLPANSAVNSTSPNVGHPESAQLFHFPDRRQIFGALHSQGAMLVRANRCPHYQVPLSTTSAAGEHVRERAFDYPIALVPEVLGNYALTRDTSRSSQRSTWNSIQVLLGGSFLKQVPLKPQTLAEIWADARAQRVSSINILFWIALCYPGCRWLLGQSRPQDWFKFLGHTFWRWQQSWETWQMLQQQKELQQFLDQQTANRVQVARQSGFQAL